jgi:transcriptional regulator with XRE-family HTH domain
MDDIAWIVAALAASGRTQTALAAHLGVSHASVSRLLRGHRKLQLHEIKAISQFLDVDPPALIPIAPQNMQAYSVMVVGIIGDGLWQDDKVQFKHPSLSFTGASAAFPNVPQSAFLLRDDIQAEYMRAGTYLLCVPLEPLTYSFRENDLCILLRQSNGFHAWILARYRDQQFRAVAPQLGDSELLSLAAHFMVVSCYTSLI